MRPICVALGVAGVAAMTILLPGLAQGYEDPEPAPIDVIADAVLIDAHCQNVSIDFGALFRYGERHGIATIDILPLGSQRKTFEAALARRTGGITHDTLCTSVAAHEQDLVPDLVRAP